MTRIALALAAALSAAPALAQDKAAEVAAVLDAAMAEAQVFIACSALDAETHVFLTAKWQEDVAETLQFLAGKGVVPTNLDTLTASALPGAYLPGPDMPFATVKALCDSHPDWLKNLRQFRGTFLPGDVKKLFDE